MSYYEYPKPKIVKLLVKLSNNKINESVATAIVVGIAVLLLMVSISIALSFGGDQYNPQYESVSTDINSNN